MVRDVLTAMIKAHEIQGVTALENSFNRVGLDHVLLVRIASTAVATAMLGGTREQVINAVSNAWIDGGALRTYRHAPNTGSRKSWAAGDATSRAVRHALIALTGEMGYPSALTAKTWGFQDVLFKGKALSYPQSLGSYVMENVLFKISYPGRVPRADRGRGGDDAAPAGREPPRPDRAHRDRDAGAGRAHHRQDRPARESRRSRSLHPVHGGDPADLRPTHRRRLRRQRRERSARRSAAQRRCRCARTRSSPRNTTQPTSGTSATPCRYSSATAARRRAIAVDFPIGHRKRRAEGMPVLVKKFEASVAAHFTPKQTESIKALFADRARLEQMPVQEFVAGLVKN